MALSERIFEKAKALVNTRPLPADIVSQLDALRKTVPAKDLDDFYWFYESAKLNQLPG